MKEFVLLKAHFSAAHFYCNPSWSPEQNKNEFGACYTPHGHGHNYRVELLVEAQADIEEINKKLREVAACLDHRHLNHDIAEFKTTIPTTENIALWILQRLTAYRKHLRSLRLYEMDDLWVEVIP